MALVPFDDRDGQIWWDGKLIAWREAKLHVLSHGLHYGSGVFEGARAYGGNIFRLREHSERLVRSGRLLGFEIPFDIEQIDQACIDTLRANRLANAYVRPLAWRGSEQLAVAAPLATIHFMVAVWEWPNLFGSDRMRGISLAMAPWKRPHPETAPVQAKATGGYITGTLSKHAAEKDGFTDALMLDWRGQVAEATGANIFFVFDGKLHTPVPDCALDGITRKTVIALARQRGLTVTERAIMPEEMASADEVFVTGTAAEVTPVRRIGELEFRSGPITAALHGDYEALVYMQPDEVTHRLAA